MDGTSWRGDGRDKWVEQSGGKKGKTGKEQLGMVSFTFGVVPVLLEYSGIPIFFHLLAPLFSLIDRRPYSLSRVGNHCSLYV